MTNKTYTKQLANAFSSDQIGLIFQNNKRYKEASLKIKNVFIPDVISHDHTSITFEYVDCLSPLLRDLWFSDQRWDTGLVGELGALLGNLHSEQGKICDSNLYLHGDFVPHNIVVRDGCFVVFDIEPPTHRRLFNTFYYGSRYTDICSMLFSLLTTHSYKKPWKFFRNKKAMVESYLTGYKVGSNFNLESDVLKKYLFQELSKWHFDRSLQHGWFIKNVKYCFLQVVLFVQMRLYKIL